MCKFDFAKPGDTIKFDYDSWTCDECGYSGEEKLHGLVGTYLGHILSKRYGLCDHIELRAPFTCGSSGKKIDKIQIPCGDQGHGLFDKSVKNVDVKRERQS